MNVEPVTLEGRFVRLEPLSLDHLPGLIEVGLDPELWRVTTTQIQSPDDLRRYIASALEERDQGTALPFATVWLSDRRPVGSTRFAAFDPVHRRVEIGWTWLGRAWQRTAANTEAKYLMLRHAFEVWGCVRVEFKTDSLNEKSRQALERIGAKEECIFRNHMILPSGRLRHSVYFSILAEEWPGVRADLERKLARG